mgnify:CR=1 FL=1
MEIVYFVLNWNKVTTIYLGQGFTSNVHNVSLYSICYFTYLYWIESATNSVLLKLKCADEIFPIFHYRPTYLFLLERVSSNNFVTINNVFRLAHYCIKLFLFYKTLIYDLIMFFYYYKHSMTGKISLTSFLSEK